MPVAALPPNVRSQLEGLGRRLHRLRLLRGTSWVALTLVLGAGIAFGLDAGLELRPVVRCVLTVVWLAGITWVAWRKLIGPLLRPVTAPALAAAVEEEYPRLGERLTSAVELADADATHGSPAFVRLLMRETEQKTLSLDFRRAAPPNTAEWLTAASVAALLAFAAPLLFIPEYYLGLGRRLVMPWDSRPAVMPFTIEVSPGDAFAARGRPLVIGVELRPIREETAFPNVCTLVLAGEDGKPNRLRMPTAVGAHAFAFRIDEMKDDLHYHIEVGPIETANHTVVAIDPVEVTSGPTASLAPPAYVKAAAKTVDGANDLTILEYGHITLKCRVDRPAEAMTLIVAPTEGTDKTPHRRPLTLAEDRRSGHVELTSRVSGKLQLELAAGHGITTLTPEQTLIVTPDRPPEFRRAAGFPERGAIRPAGALGLDLLVVDDIAVAAVDIEYQVNGGPVQREPIALAGIGSPEAVGRATFTLTGKAKDGDSLRIDLRAADNRDVPEAKLGPNVVTYPAGDRWSELRVAADAQSVREQEVVARRDDSDKRLRDLIARVDRAARRTNALQQNIEQERVSADESSQTIRQLSVEEADLSKKLKELAGDTEMAGLKPLGDALRAIDEQELRQGAEGFRDAGAATRKGRVSPLRQADASLTEARKKLEALLQENRDLADARLAEVVLNELAEREQELADQARKAASPEDRDKLAKEQERISEELAKLTQNDAALREAVQAAQSEEARRLAELARRLARAERDLDAKLAAAEKARNAVKLAELAKQQEELAADADRLSKQTRSAAESAQTPPLDAQPAAKAVTDLRSGDADEALRKQDQSARELERLADKFQQGIDGANDPRQAAKRLARLQDENRKRLDRPAEAAVARQRQEAIRRGAENIKVPEANAAGRRDRQQAAELAAEALRALNRNDSSDAEFRMGQVKEALDRLANDLPAADKSKPANAAGNRPPESVPQQPVGDASDGTPSPAQIAQARDLARRQRDLRDRVREAVGKDPASAEERATANKQQQGLAKEAGEIGQSLDDSAGGMPEEQARQNARDAAASARQAEQSLQQSQDSDAVRARRARKQAAEALERAATQAEKAARTNESGTLPNPSPKMGQKLQSAKGQMSRGQKQLGEGQPQQAAGSMESANQSLRDAAKELGQRGPPRGAKQPALVASPGKGTPTAGDLPKEMQKYSGKKWGELPGELRTRIVQDMKAQYGDDYGRIIKLYFEQIAENNGKK